MQPSSSAPPFFSFPEVGKRKQRDTWKEIDAAVLEKIHWVSYTITHHIRSFSYIQQKPDLKVKRKISTKLKQKFHLDLQQEF